MTQASVSDASHGQRGALWRLLGVALAVTGLLIGAAVPAAAAELMRVTFIRHGESAGNASGNIDTSTPGPVLTAKGQQQAEAVAALLADNNYDGIYASTMVRTQLTAAPMSQDLRLPIQVLPGLQEIEAGVFEGTPESQASSGYGLYPLAWAVQGNRNLRIPGSIDGNEFDARVDQALATIYDNGDRNPVVFSHGGAIMFWTMMNAQNLTAAQKIDLLRTAPLGNAQYVIVEGNADDGWTLVNWNGKLFAPEPTFVAEVQRQRRTLNRQLASSTQEFVDSFASRDLATIATAFNESITDAKFSVSKYRRAVRAEIIDRIGAKNQPAPAVLPADDSSGAATTRVASTEVTEASETSDDSATRAPKRNRVKKSDVAEKFDTRKPFGKRRGAAGNGDADRGSDTHDAAA
ncbi:MAG: histidine phosphatase family protein [Mycobacterium kyogaense]|uniref:histidine phosphatase family protein n=1 Tax=Mycobacterium kyogaense TaxID=2212479 RepID=UPI002FF449BB